MVRLKESLPIPANITPYLARELAKATPDIIIPGQCNVTDFFYSGDMGEILCALRHWRSRYEERAYCFDNAPDVQSERSVGARNRCLRASSEQEAETTARRWAFFPDSVARIGKTRLQRDDAADPLAGVVPSFVDEAAVEAQSLASSNREADHAYDHAKIPAAQGNAGIPLSFG
jgi:hypothetical protein